MDSALIGLHFAAAPAVAWGLRLIARGGSSGALIPAICAGLLAVVVIESTLRWPGDVFGLLQGGCWLLFLYLPALSLGAAALQRGLRRAIWGGVSALGLAVGIDAFLVEPAALEVNTVYISHPKLSAPMTLALIADVQTDVVGDYEREAIQRALDAEPDLILFAGDYVQRETREERLSEAARFKEMLLTLDIQAPAFAVEGNMEHGWGWTASFEGAPVTALIEDSSVEVAGIQLSALTLRSSFDAAAQIPASDRFHVALGHAPDFALSPDVEADLLVAGHTHGGQVQIPFYGPPLTFSKVPRAWADGVTDLGDGRTLVVSRGVGLERRTAPRLRFFCRPEIVILELSPAR